MAFWDSLKDDFQRIVESRGISTRIYHYTGSVSTADWDDAQVLSLSGAAVWTSGMPFPVKATQGSDEAVLLEQGKITTKDKVLFLPGNIVTTPIMKIGLGDPVTEEYSIVPDGVLTYPPFGDKVYKKLYLQQLVNGSLIGEQ